MKNEFDYLNNADMNFSEYEEIRLSEQESKRMKNVIKKNKKVNFVKLGSLAACIALVAALSQTAFAQGFIDKIIKYVSTGTNSFVQMDASMQEAELPEVLQGKLFDANGVAVSTFVGNTQYYDKDGNKITDIEKFICDNSEGMFKMGKSSNENTDPLESDKEEGQIIIKDPSKINEQLVFTAKMPEYIPEGFTFYGASEYETDGQYLTVYYKNEKNGKIITIHERIINEETAFSMSTDGKVEETKINGNTAAITDDRNIDWETDGIAVGISTKNAISKDEMIKMAKSFK